MNNYINYLSLLYVSLLICFLVFNLITQNKYIKVIFKPLALVFFIIFCLQMYFYFKYKNDSILNLLLWKSPFLSLFIFLGKFLYRFKSYSTFGFFLDKAASVISLYVLFLHLYNSSK